MIVIGLGYGDEGKGLTTSFLCSQVPNPLVIRFNGGQQAGHTVHHEGVVHTFSNFGSGTLQGVPTYWSKFCTFYPISFVNEMKVLIEKGMRPVIYLDPDCPVTTPWDVLENKEGVYRENSTVGMGVGPTIKRHESYYKLTVRDLQYPDVFIPKLEAIRDQYFKIPKSHASYNIAAFVERIVVSLLHAEIRNYKVMFDKGPTPIFEGAQGILLDMDYGFFPYVTRSNTTCKNVRKLIPQSQDVYYVTRSYATRHGNGPFPNKGDVVITNNEMEHNEENPFQGKFRTGLLEPDMINYALECDSQYRINGKANLVITCMDQHELDVDEFLNELDFEFQNVYLSKGPSLETIELYPVKTRQHV